MHMTRKGFVCRAASANPASVSDDVGHVALMADSLAVADHWRVVVDALAGQDFPVVEALGFAFEVPLADDGRLIAGLVQQPGERDLRAVEPLLLLL